MTRETAAVILRGLAALLALGLLLVLPPLLVATFVGRPLPTEVPSLDQLQNALTVGVDERVWLKVAALFVVLAWAVVVACFITEAVAALRGHAARQLGAIHQPQQAIARLMASVGCVISTLGPPRMGASAVATAIPAIEVVVPDVSSDAAMVWPPAHDSSPPPAQPSEVGAEVPNAHATLATVTANRHDSYWAIAERTLGSGLRWREIRDLNVGRAMPDGTVITETSDEVRANWTLLVPATANPTVDAAAPPDAVQSPASVGSAPAEVTVQPGDNLWCLAETHLATILGRPVDASETAPYWLRFIELNRSRLVHPDNPDLIYPGQTFALPAFTEPAPTPAQPTPPDSELTPAPDAPSAIPAASEAEQVTPSPTPTETTVIAPEADDDTDEPARSPDTETGAAQHDQADDNGRIAQLITKVGVGGTLSALVLMAVAKRRRARRRSARPGRRVGPPTAEDIETERALAAASDEALSTAWAATRSLRTVLQEHPELPPVVGLVVKASGDVAIYLSDPTQPIEPFVDDDTSDRPAWLLRADRIEPTADEGGAPIFETLVEVGTTDTEDRIYLDVEALGALAVVGDEERTTRLVRSLVAQLALQPLDHYVNLTVLGIEAPRNAEQGVVQIERLDETFVQQLERTATDAASAINGEGFPTTAAARANDLPRDGLVATVVAAGGAADPLLLNRLAEAAMPGGRTIGLIALGQLDTAAAHLVLSEEGDLYVPHLGLSAAPTALDETALHRVDSLLDHEPDQPGPAAQLVPKPTPEPTPAAHASPYKPPPWTYCVRVLADLQVEDNEGNTLSFTYGDNPKVPNKSAHRGPEALAYLSLLPDRAATLSQIRDDLWWGRTIGDRSVDNMLSATRTVLGGGDAHLTYGTGPTDRRRYHLTDSVVSDVELLEHALAYAKDRADDRPDLALLALTTQLARIAAPPFRDGHPGQGIAAWAAANRIVERIDNVVIASAELAAELHLKAGPEGIPAARTTLDHALRACPHNETLIRAAMELDARAGDRDQANARYQALATHFNRDDQEPEPETTALRNQIMSPGYRIG